MNNEIVKVVHKAVGAGRWFPARKETLKQMVASFIDKADVPEIEGRIVSALAPHAGYAYSGKVAGFTFRAISENAKGENMPDSIVILGLSHRGAFRGVALMTGDAIETPMGTSKLDKRAAELLTTNRNLIRMDYSPHMGEHSAENEIPFLHAILPDVPLVVGIIGDHDEQTLVQVVDALNELAKAKKILVVASTDMLHDPDYDLVSKTDRQTLKTVATLDHKAIQKAWSPHRQIFCGIMPVLAAMRFAEAQGCKQGTVLHYRNSGDDDPTGRGSWVVGYGAVVFAKQ